MANLVETFMKKKEYPDKIDLSSADRELLQRIVKTLEELKNQQKEISNQIEERASEKEVPEIIQSNSKDEKMLSRLDENMSLGHDQIKALLADRSSSIETKLNVIKALIKDEELLEVIEKIREGIQASEKTIAKQIGSVKIMIGFCIWSSLLTLAVLVAHLLQFI